MKKSVKDEVVLGILPSRQQSLMRGYARACNLSVRAAAQAMLREILASWIEAGRPAVVQ